jgi:hypothetical protein
MVQTSRSATRKVSEKKKGGEGHCVSTEKSTSRGEAMVSGIAYEREKRAKQII